MTNQKVQKRIKRHKRIRAKVQGTATRPRLVVHRSLNAIYAQIIDDDNSKVLVSFSQLSVKNKGTKTEKAKIVGKEIAVKAKDAKIESVVFDRNGYKYHGRVKALAEGAREGGLKF